MKRVIAIMAFIAAGVLTPAAAAKPDATNQPPGPANTFATKKKPKCQTYRCTVRVARKNCAKGKTNACIRRAARHHRVHYSTLKTVAWCESRLRSWAVNPSGATGLFQFLYGTFMSTPYGPPDRRKSAKWSSLAAAWLIKTDGIFHWNASRHCWG